MNYKIRNLKLPIEKKYILASLLGLGALCCWTLWTFSGRYAKDIYSPTNLQSVPPRPVAVVFGAGYWPSGQLSRILQDRLDAAIELYQAGKVEKLLFSGDNRVVDYNEPQRMREYALENGVPDTDIVLDYAGRRTYDTCYRARDIFQVADVILITQRYHLPRALTTCRALGVQAIGYSADQQAYTRREMAYYGVREVAALWNAWWDLYVNRPVPVLGEALPIFNQ